jgi:L-glutamine-phosphate cytidylyltransferase
VGFESEQILGHVAQSYSKLWNTFTFVTNPRFAETNNIYSLWQARPWIGDDSFICLNADVLCHPGIIRPAVETTSDVSMIVDPEWRDETMKVIIEDGSIRRMSKAVKRTEFSGTYVGITTFSAQVVPLLFQEMEILIKQGRVSEFFNVAVEQMISRGIIVDYTSTMGLPWAEIDDPADFRWALGNVYPLLSVPASVHRFNPELTQINGEASTLVPAITALSKSA